MKRIFLLLSAVMFLSLFTTGCQNPWKWYSDYDGPSYGPPPHRHPAHGYGVYGKRKQLKKEAGGLYKNPRHHQRG